MKIVIKPGQNISEQYLAILSAFFVVWIIWVNDLDFSMILILVSRNDVHTVYFIADWMN